MLTTTSFQTELNVTRELMFKSSIELSLHNA